MPTDQVRGASGGRGNKNSSNSKIYPYQNNANDDDDNNKR
jgi:hypothetical protein